MFISQAQITVKIGTAQVKVDSQGVVTQPGQGNGQISGYHAFTHSAFTAGNGDNGASGTALSCRTFFMQLPGVSGIFHLMMITCLSWLRKNSPKSKNGYSFKFSLKSRRQGRVKT